MYSVSFKRQKLLLFSDEGLLRTATSMSMANLYHALQSDTLLFYQLPSLSTWINIVKYIFIKGGLLENKDDDKKNFINRCGLMNKIVPD